VEIEHLDAPPSLGPRYAVALLPGRGRGRTVPERRLNLTGYAVEPAALAEYSRVCGFTVDGALPVTYPQVLSFALQVRLMSSGDFPLRLPGLVHLRQRMSQHRPVAADEALDLTVYAERLRAHPRGAQVDLVTEVEVSGERVWTGRSTYLARGARAPESDAATEPAEPAAVTGTHPGARWQLPADLGRRYARVSGDVNPIHLHPLPAKAFGFPGAIAHGMWTVARCVATLQGRLPASHSVDAVFRKPLVLPRTVELLTAARPDGWALTLRSAPDRIHLVASVTDV
jgi:acyl dehydratase